MELDRHQAGRAAFGGATTAAGSWSSPDRLLRRRGAREPRARGDRRGRVSDRDGELLAEVAEGIGVATNNVAEYRAAIAGLERCRDLGAGEVTRPRRQQAPGRTALRAMAGEEPDADPAARRGARADEGVRTGSLRTRPARAQQGRRPAGEPRGRRVARGRRRRASPIRRRRTCSPDPVRLTPSTAPRSAPPILGARRSRPGGRGSRARGRSGRGKSGLHRAGCWVTPRRGDPRRSATETDRPTARVSGRGVRVKRRGKSSPAHG